MEISPNLLFQETKSVPLVVLPEDPKYFQSNICLWYLCFYEMCLNLGTIMTFHSSTFISFWPIPFGQQTCVFHVIRHMILNDKILYNWCEPKNALYEITYTNFPDMKRVLPLLEVKQDSFISLSLSFSVPNWA